MDNSTTRVYLSLVHEYQPKVSLTEWGPIQVRTNNKREITGEDFDLALANYRAEYANHIGTMFESEWGHPHEGIYGYRWTDTHITVIRVTETIEYEQV